MRQRACAAALAITLLIAVVTRAGAVIPTLEVNGREYYGTVFTDGGEIYAALDVVGPLLLGDQFHLEVYDVTFRRCTFTFVPTGTTKVQRMELFGCVKRGAAVYAPLRQLMRQVGGSFLEAPDGVRIAYPPVTAVAPLPRPTATPRPVALPSPSPSGGAPTPQPSPLEKPSPEPAASPTPEALTREVALAQTETANAEAFRGATLIRRIEVYHPVLPDPSDAIPRTDLAGVRILLRQLGDGDVVNVHLWHGRSPQGEPAFSQRLNRFGEQQKAERALFVRLPLPVESGWHTLRVEMNGREYVEYRFMTY